MSDTTPDGPTPEELVDRFKGRAHGDVERIRKGVAEREAIEERITDAAQRGDAIGIYRELMGEASRAALRMYRKANRQGKVEDRALLEVSREARQLTDRLIELIAAEGAVAQAESFFAELQGRVESLAPLLAESAKPLTEVAS